MAPPTNRRPGFSKRAQLGLFAGYVAAVLGVIVGLGLIAVAMFDPAGFSTIRGAALDLTAPVSATGRGGVRGIAAIGEQAQAWWRAGTQNAELRRQLADARRALLRARVTEAENHRLKRLVRLTEMAPGRVAVTRIVGGTGGDTRRMATMMAGRSSGVLPGMPVRSSEGLVGRVFEAGRIAARVTLLTDGGSVVPVRILRDGSAGLAAGRGDGLLELRPLSAGANPFRPGDVAVTSGTGGLFAPGVPVAIVVERRDDVALARPMADPARLDFAIVERPAAPPLPPPPPAALAGAPAP